MTTVVSILMSDLVPLRERGVWQGIINIVYATGAGIGAPLGRLTFFFFKKKKTMILLSTNYRIRWYLG